MHPLPIHVYDLVIVKVAAVIVAYNSFTIIMIVADQHEATESTI